MARNATNKLLQQAKKSKSDEFYTQFSDIESELQHYKNHFKDKVVYCNCDDARISNFFKYFADNFKELGLKKLIAACYQEQKFDLFNTEEYENGFFFQYAGIDDETSSPNSNDRVQFKTSHPLKLPKFYLAKYVYKFVKTNKWIFYLKLIAIII